MCQATALRTTMARVGAILLIALNSGILPGSASAQAPRLEGYSVAPMMGLGGKGNSWNEITDGVQFYGGVHADRAVLNNGLVDVSALAWSIPMTCTPGISEPEDVCEDLGLAATVSFIRVYPATLGAPFWSLGFGGYLAEKWSPELVIGVGGFLRLSSGIVLRTSLRVGYTPRLYDDLNLGLFITPGRS